MRSLRLYLWLALLAIVAAGCAAPPPPHAAASLVPLTVARLNPAAADEPFDPQRPDLHGVEVLASAAVTDPVVAARIRRSLAAPDTYDGPPHRRCFLPRLMVRDGGGARATDYVICVECGRIDVYRPGTPAESYALGDEAGDFFERLAAELFPEIPSTATRPAG